jgi:Domain of unknown function (DUF4440)
VKRFFGKSETWFAAVLAAVACSATPAFARPPVAERTAAAVMTIEHAWLAALQRRDVRVLARILGREFIDSDWQGQVITRSQYLAYFARPVSHGGPRVRPKFADTNVRFLSGGTVAIVTGIVVKRPAGVSGARTASRADAAQHSRFTDVFVWRDASWQAVTGQETHFVPVAAEVAARRQRTFVGGMRCGVREHL